jgi:DNA-binding NarL/FixJ family response regulator
MIHVLIADDDMDSHELIDDLIEINFREVEIEHALTKESFIKKIGSASQPFDLILFNLDLDGSGEEGNIDLLKNRHPDLLDRTIFMVSGDRPVPETLGDVKVLSRPFSLDHFGEVVQKVCAC